MNGHGSWTDKDLEGGGHDLNTCLRSWWEPVTCARFDLGTSWTQVLLNPLSITQQNSFQKYSNIELTLYTFT
jgi:hypothetical protein